MSHAGRRFEIVDLPGLYSLAVRSPDEMVVVEALLGRAARCPSDRRGGLCCRRHQHRARSLSSQPASRVRSAHGLRHQHDGRCPGTRNRDRRGGTPEADRDPGRGSRGESPYRVGAFAGCAGRSRRVGPRSAVKPVTSAGRGGGRTTCAPGWIGPLRCRGARGSSSPLPRFLAQRLLIDVGGHLERGLGLEHEGLRTATIAARARLAAAGHPVPETETNARYEWARRLQEGVIRRGGPRRLADRSDRPPPHPSLLGHAHPVAGDAVRVSSGLRRRQTDYRVGRPGDRVGRGAD